MDTLYVFYIPESYATIRNNLIALLGIVKSIYMDMSPGVHSTLCTDGHKDYFTAILTHFGQKPSALGEKPL